MYIHCPTDMSVCSEVLCACSTLKQFCKNNVFYDIKCGVVCMHTREVIKVKFDIRNNAEEKLPLTTPDFIN